MEEEEEVEEVKIKEKRYVVKKDSISIAKDVVVVKAKPNPDFLFYNACSKGSDMQGNILRRKEGTLHMKYEQIYHS